jgi:DNA polymerase III sliding clamp (beta) subunit (PCNA family)
MNRNYLKAVMAGASDDLTRANLNSVLAHRNGDKLCLISTDGHVLFRTEFEHKIEDAPVSKEGNGAYATIKDTIIPISTCKAILALCKTSKKMVSHQMDVYMSDTEALVGLEQRVLLNPVQDMTYPPYERVIPTTEGKTVFSLNLEVLESLVAFAKGVKEARELKRGEFGINFYLGEPDAGIYFEIENNGYSPDEKSDGVIMPRRIK